MLTRYLPVFILHVLTKQAYNQSIMYSIHLWTSGMNILYFQRSNLLLSVFQNTLSNTESGNSKRQIIQTVNLKLVRRHETLLYLLTLVVGFFLLQFIKSNLPKKKCSSMITYVFHTILDYVTTCLCVLKTC